MKAEDCLRFAEQSVDVVSKATWLELADAWWRLAREAEKWKDKAEPSPAPQPGAEGD
jgi:hypothetical protein